MRSPIKIYQWMDRIFDPLPKEIKQDPKDSRAMLYYEAENKGYRRYKYRCYRDLILKTLLSFCIGILLAYILKFR